MTRVPDRTEEVCGNCGCADPRPLCDGCRRHVEPTRLEYFGEMSGRRYCTDCRIQISASAFNPDP
jgi:hypothetical protein